MVCPIRKGLCGGSHSRFVAAAACLILSDTLPHSSATMGVAYIGRVDALGLG